MVLLDAILMHSATTHTGPSSVPVRWASQVMAIPVQVSGFRDRFLYILSILYTSENNLFNIILQFCINHYKIGEILIPVTN